MNDIPKYGWVEGSRVAGVTPQLAGERLETLRQKNRGKLTPELIVKDARPKRASLHPVFEWDDTTAAEEWRLMQARYLVRSVVITSMPMPQQTPGTAVITNISDEPRAPVRAFVTLMNHTDGIRERYYGNMTEALQDDDLRDQILKRALHELEGWQARYLNITELADVYAAIAAAKAAAQPQPAQPRAAA